MTDTWEQRIVQLSGPGVTYVISVFTPFGKDGATNCVMVICEARLRDEYPKDAYVG